MNNLVISYVRTIAAPFLAGLLGQFLAFLPAGSEATPDVRLAVGAGIGMAWYLLARFAQVYNPKLGFLLIVAARPDYTGEASDAENTAEKLLMSVRRTLVPLIVGTAVTYAAKQGFDIDGATATALLNATLTSGYYGALRWIEERSAVNTAPHAVAGTLLGGKAEVKY